MAAFVTDSELERLAEPIKVYNLEVADFNTYFVGNEAFWCIILVQSILKS